MIQGLVPEIVKNPPVVNGKIPSAQEGKVHLPRPVVFGEMVIANPKMTITSTTQMDLEGLTW